MYIEKRSAHALAIDKAKRARQIHKEFNSDYAQAPNMSDVNDYDDVKIPPKNVRTQPKEPPSNSKHYEPSEEEIRKAHKILLKQDPITLYKDLLVSKNIVSSKKGFETWKKNPKFYDLQGVDTQLPKIIDNRINTVQKIVQTPIKYTNRSHRSYFGVFKHVISASDKGEITIYNKNIDSDIKRQQVVAHELGHAYDSNVLSKKNNKAVLATGNVDFFNPKYAKNKQKVMKIVKKVNFWEEGLNSSYDSYRKSKNELFADWFSGVITNTNYAKKHSKQAFFAFKHNNKDLFSALKLSDKDTVEKHLQQLKKK